MYSEIETSAPPDGTFWCFLRSPIFTLSLLTDLARMQEALVLSLVTGGLPPVETFVLCSRGAPSVFSLGGDLSLFAERIRELDRDGLRQYAQACVTTGYANYSGYGRGVVTIALIQGQALGGGFEAALSCDVLIAERHVKLGLPEVLFNLFPGMGAYTYLSRRIGSRKAEEIILGGKLYTAAEMHALGVIDMLVEPGDGERATRKYIADNRQQHRARSMTYRVGRRVDAIRVEELRDIADLWVDAAMQLDERDLRRMSRVAVAQGRRP